MIDEIRAREGKLHIEETEIELGSRQEAVDGILAEAVASLGEGEIDAFEAAERVEGVPLADFGRFVPRQSTAGELATVIERMEADAKASMDDALAKLATATTTEDEDVLSLTVAIEQAAWNRTRAWAAEVAATKAGGDGLAGRAAAEKAFWDSRLVAACDVWDWNAAVSLSKPPSDGYGYNAFMRQPDEADAERMAKVAEALSEEAVINVDNAAAVFSAAMEIHRRDEDEVAFGMMFFEGMGDLRRAAAAAVRANEYWGAYAKLAHSYPQVFAGAIGGEDPFQRIKAAVGDAVRSWAELNADNVSGGLARCWRYASDQAGFNFDVPIVEGRGNALAEVDAATAYGFAKAGFAAGFEEGRLRNFAKEMLGAVDDRWLDDCIAVARRDAERELGELTVGVVKEGKPLSVPLDEAEARRIVAEAAEVDEGEGDPGELEPVIGEVIDEDLPPIDEHGEPVEQTEDWRPKSGDPAFAPKPPTAMLKGMGL